jgi:hypothetical protein
MCGFYDALPLERAVSTVSGSRFLALGFWLRETRDSVFGNAGARGEGPKELNSEVQGATLTRN